MTYTARQMRDDVNHNNVPWTAGTFRIFHKDGRQYWSVSDHNDRINRGTAYCCWLEDGEFFDGLQWRPLTEYKQWVDSQPSKFPSIWKFPS